MWTARGSVQQHILSEPSSPKQSHYFQIKPRWAPFLLRFQRVLEGSQRFCLDFRGFCPDFMGSWPDFHQIKTFGGAVASHAPPPHTPVYLPIRRGIFNLHTVPICIIKIMATLSMSTKCLKWVFWGHGGSTINRSWFAYSALSRTAHCFFRVTRHEGNEC